jgi:hypothetical protein
VLDSFKNTLPGRRKKSRGDMEIHNEYEGREHSLITHELLKGYLETLLCIAAVSGAR